MSQLGQPSRMNFYSIENKDLLIGFFFWGEVGSSSWGSWTYAVQLDERAHHAGAESALLAGGDVEGHLSFFGPSSIF